MCNWKIVDFIQNAKRLFAIRAQIVAFTVVLAWVHVWIFFFDNYMQIESTRTSRVYSFTKKAQPLTACMCNRITTATARASEQIRANFMWYAIRSFTHASFTSCRLWAASIGWESVCCELCARYYAMAHVEDEYLKQQQPRAWGAASSKANAMEGNVCCEIVQLRILRAQNPCERDRLFLYHLLTISRIEYMCSTMCRTAAVVRIQADNTNTHTQPVGCLPALTACDNATHRVACTRRLCGCCECFFRYKFMWAHRMCFRIISTRNTTAREPTVNTIASTNINRVSRKRFQRSVASKTKTFFHSRREYWYTRTTK